MQHATHELAEIAAAAGFGMPAERLARVAARRAFVEIKLCFMRATASLDGPSAEALRERVRQADEAIELWLLRHQVFDALPPRHADAQALRRELERQLDSAFPATGLDLPR